MRYLFLLLTMATTALADTNLFNDGKWLIDGATDVMPGASDIQIVVDKVPVGAYSELKFYYKTESNGFAQVFSMTGRGDLRPALPAGNVGGAFRVGGYWDCVQGFIGHMAVTEISWKSKSKGNGFLQVSGKMANGNSIAVEKMRIYFLPVFDDLLRVGVDLQMEATRDFCVDLTKHETQEEFRAITMVSNFTSTNQHANDLVKYVKINEKNCAGIYGCVTDRESFCVTLTNAVPGLLINAPRRLGDERMFFAHSTNLPAATPTLAVVHYSPNKGRIKPQGTYVPTDDPTAENVEVFGNWVDAKKEYKAGKKILKLRVALEATPPKNLNCDSIQEPQPPAP